MSIANMATNRADFEALAVLRLDDAKELLKIGRYAAAYYLAGYAVECALKARIAAQTKAEEFPPKRKKVEDCYSHDLTRLLRAADLEAARQEKCSIDPVFASNWKMLGDWSEEARYYTIQLQQDTEKLVAAIDDVKHGVLPWLSSF